MSSLKILSQSPDFYLIALAVILLSTKIFSLASRRLHIPAVAGALAAGIILGPSLTGIVEKTDFIEKTAELGVIFIMFESGLETELKELRQNGAASLAIALFGAALPLVGGTFVYIWAKGNTEILKALFTGVTLTATSVSITVETLREMGKLSGRMGAAILGAAVTDDIIGILALTAITAMNSGNISVITVIIKILLFLIFLFLSGLMAAIGRKIAENIILRRRVSVFALAFCLFMSYCAEELFGIADITGAYFAGIVLCLLDVSGYVDSAVNVLGYLFFSPVFFAYIGINTNLRVLGSDPFMIWFAIALTITAIITKAAGCGISARLCKFSNKEALAIGIGMVSRGEVALIVAQKGLDQGLLDSSLFPAIVFMVVVTTLLTPILLGAILKKT